MPYPGFQAFSPYSLKTPTPASLPGPSQAVSTPGRPSFPTQPGTGCLLTGTRSKPTTSEQGGRVPFPHPRLLNTRWLCWKHGLQHPECHPNPSLHSHKAGGTTHHRTCTTPHHPWASSLPGLTQTPTSRTAPLCASQGYPVTSALDADNAAKDIVPLTLSLPASAPPPVCRSSPAKQKGGRSPEHNTTFRLHNL